MVLYVYIISAQECAQECSTDAQQMLKSFNRCSTNLIIMKESNPDVSRLDPNNEMGE
jgi:hypothetical protein